jgi:hypothetical protein
MSLRTNFRWNYGPYCIQRLTDGTWLPLNRRYKPLGLCQLSAWVDYDKFGGFTVNMTEALASEMIADSDSIWRNDAGEITRVYFYGDGTNPDISGAHFKSYMKRLEVFEDAVASAARAGAFRAKHSKAA